MRSWPQTGSELAEWIPTQINKTTPSHPRKPRQCRMEQKVHKNTMVFSFCWPGIPEHEVYPGMWLVYPERETPLKKNLIFSCQRVSVTNSFFPLCWNPVWLEPVPVFRVPLQALSVHVCLRLVWKMPFSWRHPPPLALTTPAHFSV